MAEVSPAPGVDDVVSGEQATFRVLCHELRQPLGVAMGYVSMLEDGAFGDLPGDAQAILATVVARLEALNEIIERHLVAAEPEPDATG